jgi:hypothetical protein
LKETISIGVTLKRRMALILKLPGVNKNMSGFNINRSYVLFKVVLAENVETKT